jgi:hypothetical protein
MNISLNLYSGSFSYAEIPKMFKNIIGVTGTLRTLSKYENKIIKDVYKINQNTFIPSIYANILGEEWKKKILIEKERNEYD